jgi:hypothetical protein
VPASPAPLTSFALAPLCLQHLMKRIQRGPVRGISLKLQVSACPLSGRAEAGLRCVQPPAACLLFACASVGSSIRSQLHQRLCHQQLTSRAQHARWLGRWTLFEAGSDRDATTVCLAAAFAADSYTRRRMWTCC